MTNNSEQKPPTQSNGTDQIKSLNRRRIIFQGGVGLAGLTTAIVGIQANTQHPAASETGKANPSGQFADKVVLITGATSGIGEATARAFAKEGAIVHFCGRRENLGTQVAQSIVAAGGRATYEKASQGFVTKRVMSPDEMARAVMFLASEQATSVTGTDLDVTGGQLAQ